MSSRIYLLLLFITLPITFYAQSATNIWYFGANAGIDFNSGSPVALTNGQLSTSEGCSSIADNSGNLLFYTDGITIWNRLHNTMANGTGLLGDLDATQSGVIVQKPGSSNIYYVFAVAPAALAPGITYSEVDMNLSATLGAVTGIKNVVLTSPSTEKLAAVRHCNKRDIWIVTHDWNSDTFRTFLFTPIGINPIPVISKSGTVHTGSDWNTNGYLKSSPDGSKLALAACHGMNIFELFDFDNSTGIVSNAVPLSSIPSTYGAYGVEFSPDGTKLYGTTIQTARLIQYDLCAGSATAINNSRTVIDSSTTWFGALQLGPDKKIYVSRLADSLGVINNPNNTGVGCNFAEKAISLNGQIAQLGLPTFINNYFDPPVIMSSTTTFCLTDSFYVSPGTCIKSNTMDPMTWNFGDPASGVANSSTATNPSHIFSSPGTYTVSVILNHPCSADTLYSQVSYQPLTSMASVNRNVLCYGDSNGIAQLSNPTGGTAPYKYSWLPLGKTTQVVTGLTSGSYSLIVTDTLNCVTTSTIAITQPNLLVALSTPTVNVCMGMNTNLSASAMGGSPLYNFLWSPASGISTSIGTTVIFNSTNNSIYTITVTDANGCTDTTQININVLAKPNANITGDSLICIGDNATLNAAGGGTYTWSNGATDVSIQVTPVRNTNFTLTVTSNGCTDIANFFVSLAFVNANAGTDTTIIKGASTTLQASGGENYLWNNGLTTSSIVASPLITTTYCVYVTNNINCRDTDCVTITVEDPCGFIFVPNAFSPNGDGQNDVLSLIGTCVEKLQFSIFNRWGEKVFETHDLSINWDGKYKSQEINTDVFFYTLHATFQKSEELFQNGNINLIK